MVKVCILQVCCRKFEQCFSPHVTCCNQKYVKKDKASCGCQAALGEACRSVCTEVGRTKVASVFLNTAAAALMLAWPFEEGYSERSDRLAKLAKEEVGKFSPDTRNEICLLSTQLCSLIKCSKPPPMLWCTNESKQSECCPLASSCSCKCDIKLQ
ncbi:hypothetical protein COOONC_24354 [Cooperia oncophora]